MYWLCLCVADCLSHPSHGPKKWATWVSQNGGKMAAENAEASALAELGGAGHPTKLKARAVEPLICCKTKEEWLRPTGLKSLFFPFQLCLNVRTQIRVLIISICNAAGCWGSHSQFSCQCAKTTRIVKRKREGKKNPSVEQWENGRCTKKSEKKVELCNRELWVMTATSDTSCL